MFDFFYFKHVPGTMLTYNKDCMDRIVLFYQILQNFIPLHNTTKEHTTFFNSIYSVPGKNIFKYAFDLK